MTLIPTHCMEILQELFAFQIVTIFIYRKFTEISDNLNINGIPFNRDNITGNFTVYFRTDGSCTQYIYIYISDVLFLVYIPAKLSTILDHDGTAWYSNETLLSIASTFEVIEPGTYQLLVNDNGCQATTTFQVHSAVVNVTTSNATVTGTPTSNNYT